MNGVCEDCDYVQVVTTVWDIPDFVIEIEADRDARVLFLADMQIIDSSQMRTPDRLGQSSIDAWAPENMEEMCFKYICDAFKKSEHDFIILLGDNVYGEFDDKGTSLQALIEVMDSFEIPWSPVYGNHDNESKKGAKWQNAQFEISEYCYFKKGDTDGNGNYIRWTYGLKTGTYDSHIADEVGSTFMTFNKSSYFIKHLYYDATVQAKMDALRGIN